LQIQRVDRAGTVGYGAIHRVTGKKIATIAVGYADGYLRSLGNNGVCAIDGIMVPVIGRISMDLVTVDVTQVPDEVIAKCKVIELIGDNVPVDFVAEKAGTISYEILTSLGDRYKRIYVDKK
jgi:alanine racemase